jgi:hypothetical protein
VEAVASGARAQLSPGAHGYINLRWEKSGAQSNEKIKEISYARSTFR